jgi:hypothetical protein
MTSNDTERANAKKLQALRMALANVRRRLEPGHAYIDVPLERAIRLAAELDGECP